ncbi:MAG: hypothetical protein IJ686_00155 [Bacteroidales bacterium]|nr:hypothetical protein [Bacteroidales bacterium]
MKCFKISVWWWVFALLAIPSCSEELPVNPSGSQNLIKKTIRVSGDPQLRSALQEDGSSVSWAADDAITVFANGTNYQFTATGAGSSVEFEGSIGSEDEDAAQSGNGYWALYPYNATTSTKTSVDAETFYPAIDESVITLQFQHEQKGYPGTFDPAANVTIGHSADGTDFYMKNLCGLLSINIASSDISKIVLMGYNGNEKIGGLIRISAADDGTPSFAQTGLKGSETNKAGVLNEYAACRIFLTPASGETFTPGTYYICVPACTLPNGLRLRITRSDGKITEVCKNSELKVERSAIRSLGTLNSANLTWNDAIVLELNRAEYDLNNGKALHWPFNVSKNSFSSGIASPKAETYLARVPLTTDEGYTFYLWGSDGASPHATQGFRFGHRKGDYFEFPAIKGKKLTKVRVGAGTTESFMDILSAEDSAPYKGDGTVNGSSATVEGPQEINGRWKYYAWTINDPAAFTPYRFAITENRNSQTGWTGWNELVLIYEDASVADGTVYSASTGEPAYSHVSGTDSYKNINVTFKGNFEYSGSYDYTAGFEWRVEGEEDWNSVEASIDGGSVTANAPVVWDLHHYYEYRVWVQGASEKVYGKVHLGRWMGFHAYAQGNNSQVSYQFFGSFPHLSEKVAEKHHRTVDFTMGNRVFTAGAQHFLWRDSASSTNNDLSFNNANTNALTTEEKNAGLYNKYCYAYFTCPAISNYRLKSFYAFYKSDSANSCDKIFTKVFRTADIASYLENPDNTNSIITNVEASTAYNSADIGSVKYIGKSNAIGITISSLEYNVHGQETCLNSSIENTSYTFWYSNASANGALRVFDFLITYEAE